MTGPDHSARTRAGQALARARGVHIGRPRALPSRTLEAIRTMRSAGFSNRAIADKLNDGGIPGAAGGRWYESSIRRVLRVYGEA